MNIKRSINLLFVLLVVLSGWSRTAAAQPAPGVLDNYIEMGLKGNLALKQQEFSLEKSLQALREARGMFFPSVSIEVRYSRAGGGRVIDMPIGDLVNPIHNTLNQLLIAHGFSPVFPGNIPNEHIPFLRETEQESKLRIVQPVFQPAIYYNLKIKTDLSGIERARLKVFKRQLVEDIKSAYYTYLKTLEIKKLLDNTRVLLAENLRISESLFRNHKVTEEVVFRSKAELSKLDQQLSEAEKNNCLSASYFNFLLNRPMDTEIEVEEGEAKPGLTEYNLEILTNRALAHRGEFEQLRGAIAAARHTANLHGAGLLPTVSAVFDYGVQGENFSFSGKDDYWMGSVLLSWNVFKGGQDAAKKKQAQYEGNRLQTQYDELENQIRLQVKEAFLNLDVAKKTIISNEDTLKSQEEAFSIVTKKYEQGMVPQIEYIKAQNDYTSAGIAHIIAGYDYYIKEAQLERVSALRGWERP